MFDMAPGSCQMPMLMQPALGVLPEAGFGDLSRVNHLLAYSDFYRKASEL